MNNSVFVNDKPVKARKGETILNLLSRIGIEVPTLCHMKSLFPSGSCRMCVVEVDGNKNLVPSCSQPVAEGMKIHTHSSRVIEARKVIVELLLSNHPDDCLYCIRNGNCELQGLSEELDIKERRISGMKNNLHMDKSSTSIVRDPAKCILCGRCVRQCEEVLGVSAIDFIGRGSSAIIGAAFNKGLNTSSCVNCGQCILVCPTGALHEKGHFPEIKDAIDNPKKNVIVQYAPAISVSIAEEFGIKEGKDINGLLNAALRKIGFDKIFDTSFTADLTIMEESAELISRIQNNKTLPLFTSCCPAWVKYIEQFYPEFIPNISSCKSPQQMMGAIIKRWYTKTQNLTKEDVYSVSIMPCTAKKFEAQRENMTHEGVTDVDAILTTRELVKLIKMYGIDLKKLEPELADTPLGTRSSAGKLFAASGGVTEAAVRTAYFKLTGEELVQFKINAVRGNKGIKETHLQINDQKIGVAVVNGLGNAAKILSQIKEGRNDLHFVEVMACPGGCIAGGGQRIGAEEKAIRARINSLYDIDEKESLKVAHRNQDVQELYDILFKAPLSGLSHEYLHTTYCKRDVLL